MAENSGDLSLGYMMGQSDGNNGGFGGGMWEGIWGIVLLAMVLGWGNGGFGGFGGGGATFEDIELFSKHIGSNVKMKAAGGISSLDDAEKFLSLGADRLGTSRIIKIVKNEEASGY